LKTDFPDRAVYSDVDPDAIRRVVVNLLENAWRYTPHGEVSVSITADPTAITVEDTGSGIPAADLPKIGQRFYRADAARAGDTGGVGLGLAICQAIMEAHGGRLEIQSEVGKGTRVRAIFDTFSSKAGNQTTSS
jgi:two-component system, OmpR family, sensor histidine kinase BaeS